MKTKSHSRSAFFNPRILIGLLLCLGGVMLALLTFRSASAQGNAPSTSTPISAVYRGLSPVVHFDISPPLRDMKIIPPDFGQLRENEDQDIVPRNFYFGFEPDPVVQSQLGEGMEIPPPLISFDGQPGSASPPDPNGEVGPNHFVTMCNLSFQIFSKTGTSLFGPAANNTLWAGFGGPCQTQNAGDPVVLYDQLADRWLLSQFTAGSAPFFNCVAISQTSDPTGAYFRYAFMTGTTGANFPDYPKYAVWPDAYYISTREFLGSGGPFQGVGAYALNRAQMLVGNPTPQVVSFIMPPGGTPYNVGDGLLAADLDGTTLPPAGSPEYFVGSMDNNGQYGAPQDALTLYKFHVDFAVPGNSTFALTNTIPVASFNSILGLCGGTRACIPQLNTTNRIDHLGYRQRPLHRLAYRNFGTHESLVTNQSVSAGTGPGGEVSGIRWWELRSPNVTPVIFQEGTFAPGLTDGIHRWMGSIAMDSAGNMALGYSASNAQIFPSILYTGRLAGSPLGTMPLGENSIKNGTGSQTGGGNRWGDYTAISVDPTDDLTFWYVNEYLPTTSGSSWRLRIGSFQALPGGASPTPFPSPTPTATPTATFTPGGTVTPTPCGSFTESFDGVVAPALPAGWVASNAQGAAPLWVTSTTTPDTAPNDAFVDDPATISDKYLDTPSIPINSASGQISFRHFYNTEPTFDGGVLEVSSPNINGGTFTDITSAAVGGSFVSGGYTGAISTAFMSPISGRMAWNGNSNTYVSTVANLGANVNGQTIKLRFRMASDNSVSATGWRVDTVVIAAGPCGTPTPGTPTPTATATATGGTPPPTPTCAPGWSAGPPLPAVGGVRAVGVFFPANGRFYSIGGRSSDTAGNNFTNPFEYNPATNAWVTKAAIFPDINVNNMACGVLTVGGTPQIYCVGGSAGGGTTSTGRVFSYNPVTDAITPLTGDDWPGALANTTLPGGFAVTGNKLYVIGGFTIGANATAQTWQFDPTLGVGAKWLQRQDLPVARGYVPAAAIGGIIYTGGGADITAAVLTDTADSFKYDPATNTWTTITNIPRATGETRGVVVNNQMWVLGGGRVAPNPSNEVDIYNPGSNTWTTGQPFATARRNFPADSDGTRVWLVGGYDTSGTTLLNTMEIFGSGACPSPSGTPTATATATATVTPTATATGSPPASPTPTETPTATPTLTPTPTPTTTPSPSSTPAAQALNLSTRLRVQANANVGIGGFIVTGSAPKRILLRGIGPSLTAFGVPDALADPVMELHGPTGFVTLTNDNWRDTQEAEIQATGIPPTDNLESAIIATLPPAAYTAILSGKNNTAGVALIEVYDLDQAAPSQMANISTRAFVDTGSNVVIAGFILGNNPAAASMILRGIGPSLTAFGVPDALADPTLELRNNNGALLSSNNDWQDDPSQAAIISAAGLAPTEPLESGIAANLAPGQYTAILAGQNNGTGVGLVEAYNVGSGGPITSPTPGTPTPTATATATFTPGGVSPTPTATATAAAGPCVENFDGVTAPTLPTGWVATNPDPGDGTLWVTSTVTPDTAPNDAFIGDQDGISDKVLDRTGVAITSAAPMMSFRNNFNTEFSGGVYWDGYVLEVSAPNISGGDFLDITDSHVGGSFVSGGYTGEIDGSANNPLAGRMAWSGSSGGYINTVINLGPNLVGQTVTFRFRMGTDEAAPSPGVWIDTISIMDASCP